MAGAESAGLPIEPDGQRAAGQDSGGHRVPGPNAPRRRPAGPGPAGRRPGDLDGTPGGAEPEDELERTQLSPALEPDRLRGKQAGQGRNGQAPSPRRGRVGAPDGAERGGPGAAQGLEQTQLSPVLDGGRSAGPQLEGGRNAAQDPERTQLSPALDADLDGERPQRASAPKDGRPRRRPAPNARPRGGPEVEGERTQLSPVLDGKQPLAADRTQFTPVKGIGLGTAEDAEQTQLSPAAKPASDPERTQLSQAVEGPNGKRPRRTPARPAAAVRAEMDPLTMTDEMEAIDEATQYRRKIDHSLARFSAAHDDAAAEEAKRRERRERLTTRSMALFEQTRTALQRVVLLDKEEEEEQPAEKPEQTRLQEKKQRHTARNVRIGRIALIVVVVLIFVGTGVAWGAVTWFDAKFAQVSALDENSSDIQNADAQANDENFLMVGSDSRDGASAEENVGDASNIPGARSDTVMVAHVPADRKRVVVVSFPRDLEIDRPDCNRWDPAKSQTTDEVVREQKIAKLNTAYAVGGPQCMTKVIQKITGLRINHFVGIDFNGFKEMVDAVHGVTVHNEKPIIDTTLGKVLTETGDVTISGDQALSYVRARHVIGDKTSDYGRIKRQQGFIGALLKKVMSSDVVLDPGRLSGFITAFAHATFGDNLGVQQMMTLAQSMRGLDPANINFLTVPTVGLPNKRGNEVLIQEKTKSLFDALRDNTPLPGSQPAETAANAPPPANAGSGKNTNTG
ncbi:LCP family protein [Amycolatopsis sp. FU40]|nr:LCP family protein [Amycolatopsis sp. FU40]UKD52904.1 LCP family protein [Amycolatopsis sp. FU40]